MSTNNKIEGIASELAYIAFNNSENKSEFAFEFEGKKVIIKIESFQKNEKAPDRTYVSLGPPGEDCQCCNGTGVQSREDDQSRSSGSFFAAG